MIAPAWRFVRESETTVTLAPEGKETKRVETVGRTRPPCCTCEKPLSGPTVAYTHNDMDYEDPIRYPELYVCPLSGAFPACKYT